MNLSGSKYSSIEAKDDFLRALDLFKNVDEAAISNFAQKSKIISKQKNEMIFGETEKGRDFFIIAAGNVKISKSCSNGKEINVSLLSAGDSFGEMSLLEGEGRNADAVALTNCLLFAIHVSEFNQLLMSAPAFSYNLLLKTLHWLKEANKLVKSVTLETSNQGVLNTLRILAEKYGSKEGEKMIIPQLLSHDEMAALSGTSRKNFTITLGKLEKDGVLRRSGETRNEKKIIINNYQQFKIKYCQEIRV